MRHRCYRRIVASTKARKSDVEITFKMEAPLVAVQLSPERMQSIGAKPGTVEYKRLSDEIRATGIVDIDERLLSYVQVRFPDEFSDKLSLAARSILRE
jgi:hypothetical protein